MFGGNRFSNAETDENKAADEETDNNHFLFLERLKAEERNLGVQQPAADKRQTYQRPCNPVVRDDGDRHTA